MMKQRFWATIFSALLLMHAATTLFAQQTTQAATEEPSTLSGPSEKRVLDAVSRRDQHLQREIQEQLASDAAFQSVKVNVSNSVVLLEGAVASEKDKQRAKNMVKVFPGVTGIDEQLTVNAHALEGSIANSKASFDSNTDSTMSEASEVAHEIAAAIADEPTLAERQINVRVSGDSIELTGRVTTKKERERAKEIAQSFAVHSHVVDRLTVAPPGSSKNTK